MEPSTSDHSPPHPSWDIRGVVPVREMRGDCEEDTVLLGQMLEAATSYLRKFDWCSGIGEVYFGDGVGGIAAVFLFRILPTEPGIQAWYWVVVGDLPPAHLVTNDLKNPHDVLEAYMALRLRWVRYALRNENPPPEIMPVLGVPPTAYWGNELLERIKDLNEHVLPYFRRE